MKIKPVASIIYEQPGEESKSHCSALSQSLNKSKQVHQSTRNKCNIHLDYSFTDSNHSSNKSLKQTLTKKNDIMNNLKSISDCFSIENTDVSTKLSKGFNCKESPSEQSTLNAIEITINQNISNDNSTCNNNCVNYQRSCDHFESFDYSKLLPLITVEDCSNRSLCAKIIIKLNKKKQLHKSLLKSRQFVFIFLKTPIDMSNQEHNQIGKIISRSLIGLKEEFDWNYFGGIQGDKSINNDNAGLFGLMQLLYISEAFPQLLRYVYEIYELNNQKHAFIEACFKLSRNTIEMLRNGKLVFYCNKNKNVSSTLNNFYSGSIIELYDHFKTKQGTLVNFEDIITNVIKVIQKNISNIFWKATKQPYINLM